MDNRNLTCRSLLFLWLLLLTACGSSDFTLESLPSELQGKWKGTCVNSNSSSYAETWNIKNGVLKNTILVWNQVACPTNVASEKIKLEATIYTTSSKRKDVSTVCKNGKAVITETILTKLTFNNGGQIINGDKNIRNTLASKKLTNILPAYDLTCLDVVQKLHTGDLRTGDGSTEAKRPTEMNSERLFIKQ